MTVISGASIQTGGVDAHAIVAQSIGGGGGFIEALASNGALLVAR